MRDGGMFPDVAVKMTEVGESTGALQDMLNSLADFYDEEIETNLDRFVTLVEPVLLIIMGLVIAGLLLALYMPLFQLTRSSVSRHGSGMARLDDTAIGDVTDGQLTRDSRTEIAPPKIGSRRSRRRGGWRSATGSSSSTWISSGSTASCSARFPADLMLRYGFVPYRREGKSLVIVVSDPTDLPMIDELVGAAGDADQGHRRRRGRRSSRF